MEKKRIRPWAIAVVICCILPCVLIFFIVQVGPVAPAGLLLIVPLGIVSGVLGIIAIRKCELGRETLVAFICCIWPFFLPPLAFFRFLVLGLGMSGVVLAIIAIVQRQSRTGDLAIIVPGIIIVLGILDICASSNLLFLDWSCGPLVYSFDGKEFVFDSEPYAGAISIEQTRYSKLNRLATADRQYQLKMANELNEIQYTDELKLLVVEHPVGTDVVPDVTGHIHTIASPVTPTCAFEPPGTDILGLVSEKDNRFWEGGLSDKSFSTGIGERKELILEFPKPQNAKRAKLVMNVSNTLWSSSASANFLQSFGNSYPVMSAVRSWARKGFIRFEVQAWENGKWTTKGWIRGASPHLPKDQVLVLDVSAIAGQSLKLRLMPAAGFWRINSAIVDYGEDVPIRVIELEAAEAVNHKGQDIRQVLRADDDIFYVTQNGDHAIITFDEPPPVPNMARSFVLKATGCYKIHTSD